jgi:hypothetical protein
VKPIWLKGLLGAVIALLMFVTPVVDEIIGKAQFERLCNAAAEVRIYGTLPGGQELYTVDGKWRQRDVSLPIQENNRLQRLLESMIRWDLGSSNPEIIAAAIPIRKYHERIFDRRSGNLLAEWDHYATSGGAFSRNFEKPLLVRAQCMPELVEEGELQQRLLPFKQTVEPKR